MYIISKIMKKNILKNVVIIICISFILTGCSISNKEEKSIDDKVKEELNYLEDSIFLIVNKYGKSEYKKDENEINWDSIREDTEKINNSLIILVSDLSEVGISNEDILAMRNEINNVLISCGNKDDKSLIQSLSRLYNILPNYLEKMNINKNEVNLKKVKGLVLSSYSNSVFLSWEEGKNIALQAEAKYKEMMNDVDYIREYSYNLNKVYILVEEYKNAVEQEEVELVNVKYLNFIEKI